jgi:archaemetzincin
VPEDTFAIVSVTLEDLYPDPNWNFVFGRASPRHRVGVYSFALLDPRFYTEQPPPGWRGLLLERMCKILAHETGHLFGIKHCTAYRCLMNGSNHLNEFDARPLHLCPVDLRKLQYSVGFDPLERYRRLLRFTREEALNDEAEWLAERVRYVEGGGPA